MGAHSDRPDTRLLRECEGLGVEDALLKTRRARQHQTESGSVAADFGKVRTGLRMRFDLGKERNRRRVGRERYEVLNAMYLMLMNAMVHGQHA
jgi:hypothetical protein